LSYVYRTYRIEDVIEDVIEGGVKATEIDHFWRGRLQEINDGYAIIDGAGAKTLIVEEKYLVYPEPL